ncbi:MAG: hypothetical protein R2745_12355 [Vicinamibacterales bacterium]
MTSSSVSVSPEKARTWSKALSESRMLPSPALARSSRASSGTAMPSASATTRRRSATVFDEIVRNSYTCDRDSTVSGILCSSVVAIMNTTCGGGSSIDFRSALNDEFDSMWTSSIRKTL